MNPADAIPLVASPVAEVTILGMFMNASVLVKVIMLGLLGSSMWCWAIIINKMILFAATRKAMDKFEQVFWSGQSLEELYTNLSQGQTIGMASLFVGAMREWKRSFQNVGASFMGLHARLEKVLDVSIAREVEKLESSLIVLATVASTAPFVGLFGTVWGIMTSFRSIAASKNTSLAVIAPGLAEALLATAIGLFAAIPALIFFNNLQGCRGALPGPYGELRRRVLVDPVPPDRPSRRRRARPRGLSRAPEGEPRWACRPGLQARRAVGASAGCRATAPWPKST